MQIAKLIVTGQENSGKSSFLSNLGGEMINLGKIFSEPDPAKDIELARLEIPPDIFLYLIASPSDQVYWPFWEKITKGLLGFIVIHRPGQSSKTTDRDLISEIQKAKVPLLLAVNTDGQTSSSSDTKIPSELAVDNSLAVFGDLRQPKVCRQLLTKFIFRLSNSRKMVKTAG